MSSVKVYKTLLKVLKYQTEDYSLIADSKGYYSISDILKIIRKLHPEYKYITVLNLKHSAACDVKNRIEITKDLTKVKYNY